MRISLLMALVLTFVLTNPVLSVDHPGCKPYSVSINSPTGIVGCEVYGVGIASWYHGSGAARNDCIYPWENCQPISIRSLDTNKTIVVTPVSYCDCYLGDNDDSNDRIVDLSYSQVLELGLNPDRGLFLVEVFPEDDSGIISNTALGDDNGLRFR